MNKTQKKELSKILSDIIKLTKQNKLKWSIIQSQSIKCEDYCGNNIKIDTRGTAYKEFFFYINHQPIFKFYDDFFILFNSNKRKTKKLYKIITKYINFDAETEEKIQEQLDKVKKDKLVYKLSGLE